MTLKANKLGFWHETMFLCSHVLALALDLAGEPASYFYGCLRNIQYRKSGDLYLCTWMDTAVVRVFWSVHLPCKHHVQCVFIVCHRHTRQHTFLYETRWWASARRSPMSKFNISLSWVSCLDSQIRIRYVTESRPQARRVSLELPNKIKIQSSITGMLSECCCSAPTSQI